MRKGIGIFPVSINLIEICAFHSLPQLQRVGDFFLTCDDPPATLPIFPIILRTASFSDWTIFPECGILETFCGTF